MTELDKKILVILAEVLHDPDHDKMALYIAKIRTLVYEERLAEVKEARKFFNQTVNDL